MLEYVFFHKTLAQAFVKQAENYKLETSLVNEGPAWEVHLSEDIADDIEEKLSDIYDDLFDQDHEMFDNEHQGEDGEYGAAAIEITLKDGKRTYAQLNPAIMGKLMSVISFNELNEIIEDVVTAVENPDDRTICQRYRDKESSNLV